MFVDVATVDDNDAEATDDEHDDDDDDGGGADKDDDIDTDVAVDVTATLDDGTTVSLPDWEPVEKSTAAGGTSAFD